MSMKSNHVAQMFANQEQNADDEALRILFKMGLLKLVKGKCEITAKGRQVIAGGTGHAYDQVLQFMNQGQKLDENELNGIMDKMAADGDLKREIKNGQEYFSLTEQGQKKKEALKLPQ